jgi:hypothetical protein
MQRFIATMTLRATILGFAIAGLVAAVPAEAASGCLVGCNMAKSVCLQGARTTKLECKTGCRENAAPADLGACIRGCVDAFRATRHDVCLPDLMDCRDACVPVDGGGGDACLATCGDGLAMCARGVVADGRDCVQGCRGDSDHVGCLASCADSAKAGAATCESDFTSCLSGCGGGSPSGAFVTP